MAKASKADGDAQAASDPSAAGAAATDRAAGAGGDVESAGVAGGDGGAERAPDAGLTVGRVVHYVLGLGYANAGQCRAAMVVRTWGAGEPYPIQLQVFLDGTNDDPYEGRGLDWRSSVPYSSGNMPGTWHWPERA